MSAYTCNAIIFLILTIREWATTTKPTMTAAVAGNVRTTYLWKPEGTALLLLDNNERLIFFLKTLSPPTNWIANLIKQARVPAPTALYCFWECLPLLNGFSPFMKSLKKCGGKSGKFGKELLLPFCSYSDANAMLMIFFERPPGRGDACCHCAGAAVHYGLGLERPKLGFTVSVVAVL